MNEQDLQLGRIEAKVDANRDELGRMREDIHRRADAEDAIQCGMSNRVRHLEQELTRQKTIVVVISSVVSFVVVAATSLGHLIMRALGK